MEGWRERHRHTAVSSFFHRSTASSSSSFNSSFSSSTRSFFLFLLLLLRPLQKPFKPQKQAQVKGIGLPDIQYPRRQPVEWEGGRGIGERVGRRWNRAPSITVLQRNFPFEAQADVSLKWQCFAFRRKKTFWRKLLTELCGDDGRVFISFCSWFYSLFSVLPEGLAPKVKQMSLNNRSLLIICMVGLKAETSLSDSCLIWVIDCKTYTCTRECHIRGPKISIYLNEARKSLNMLDCFFILRTLCKFWLHSIFLPFFGFRN